MAVVLGLAGGELALPLQRQSHALKFGRACWRYFRTSTSRDAPAFPGGVLGRQPECVPTHRMHDREAARPLVPGDHIPQRVVAHMAHMDLAAGIRKHLQHVVFRLAVLRHIVHAEAAALGPGLLPFRFGGSEVVARTGFGAAVVVSFMVRCIGPRSVACRVL